MTQPVSTYTAHASTATAAAGAFVAIVSWVLSLKGIVEPDAIVAAEIVLITPIASVVMKYLDILSA